MDKRNLYAIDIPDTGITYIGISKSSDIHFGERAILNEVIIVDTSTLTDRKKYKSYAEGAESEWNERTIFLKSSWIEKEVNKIINLIREITI